MRGVLLLLALLWASPAQADVVFTTKHRSQADLVVFVTTSSEGQPVWKAPRKSAASDPCRWFFTPHRSQSDYLVYFTKNRAEADVVVRWVPRASDAKCDMRGC